MEKSLLIVATLLGLVSVALAASGTAIYYTRPYMPSACYGNKTQGTMIVVVSDSLRNNGKICGTMYTVKCTTPARACTGKSVTVKVVDRCSGCRATLDLSKEASPPSSPTLMLAKSMSITIRLEGLGHGEAIRRSIPFKK